MRSRRMLLLLLLVLVAQGSGAADEWTATCVEVTDGDSIIVDHDGEQVALLLDGIDAPEIGQSFGDEARQYLDQLVNGKELLVQPTGATDDGELRARVLLGATDLSRDLLDAGLAWHDTDNNDEEALVLALVMARSAGKGLWQEAEPVSPVRWRQRIRESRPTPTPRPKGLSDLARGVEIKREGENGTIRIVGAAGSDGGPGVIDETDQWVDYASGCPCTLGQVEACAQDQLKRLFPRVNSGDGAGVLRAQPPVVVESNVSLVIKGVSSRGQSYSSGAFWPKDAGEQCAVTIRVPKIGASTGP